MLKKEDEKIIGEGLLKMQGTCWYALFISILDEEAVAAEQDVAGSTLTYVHSLMPDTITKVAFSTSYHPRYLRGAKEAR